jgi:outer membrane protein
VQLDVKSVAAAAFALSLLISATQAQDRQRWSLRAGVHPMQPKPDNHASIDVSDGAAVTFSATYMLDRHWGIEALAALPVTHDMAIHDAGKVARFEQLPPTLTVQYYFYDPNGRIRAYVGAGLNYTTFHDERTSGALAGAQLSLASSIGPSAQLGLEFDSGGAWFVALDARWFDIDSDARLDGVSVGAIELDPYAVGMFIGRRLR